MSLTFDEAMATHLRNATLLMNKHNIKGTFYVNTITGIDWNKNLPGWSRAVSNGHEIGNHTDQHPCACRHTFGINQQHCLERLSMADIEQIIDGASKTLRREFSGGLVDRSFAYPCFETFVGNEKDSYVPEVAKRYLTGRIGENRETFPIRRIYICLIPSPWKE